MTFNITLVSGVQINDLISVYTEMISTINPSSFLPSESLTALSQLNAGLGLKQVTTKWNYIEYKIGCTYYQKGMLNFQTVL